MKFEITGKFERAAEELSGRFGFTCGRGGIPVTLEEGEGLSAVFRDGKLTVRAKRENALFFALKYLSDEEVPLREGELFSFPAGYELCYMLDCSRNAVPTEETLFELVRHLAVLGYDGLGLYTEDTFEVPGLPYFGYLRNPLSAEKIARTERYCALFGIELVPYIQTLAHFNALKRHPAFSDLFDTDDVLLVGDEKTYAFLDRLLSACASSYSSRNIHIGMDEAYALGRGVYLDRFGARSRFDIMVDHLSRVLEICKKYGYERPMIWSDMFFSLTLDAQYGADLPEALAARVPSGVELVYWDYCSTSRAHYAQMLEKHRVFRNPVSFAGGAWKWLGYTPDNRYSFAASEAAASACAEAGVRKFIVTGWGDNGGECSVFATLPALSCNARLRFGLPARGKGRDFVALAGIGLDDFLAIDLANRLTGSDDVEEKNSANKFLLFNDPLLGTLDTLVPEGLNDRYAAHARKLGRVEARAGRWRYLFETQRTLCRVLAVKAELGVALRKAYRAEDGEELARLSALIGRKLLPRLKAFYAALKAQWEKENMPNGFDVQDLRLGALERRIRSAKEKLDEYLSGKREEIGELGERLLCFTGHGEDFEKDYDQCEWRWRRMSSVNVNE